MRSGQLLIALFVVSLVAAACGTAPADTSAPPGSAPSSPAARTAVPTSSAAPSPTGSALATPPASTPACTMEAPTAASTEWTSLNAHDGDFTFKVPATWDRLYGAFVFDTASLVDRTTFAETRLPMTSETRADLVRAPDVGLPNASVLIVPGVTSDTPTIFARQVERFGAISTIAVLNSGDTACLGGDIAHGIRFTFSNPSPARSGASAAASPSPTVTYQESWYVVRSGRLYDFQWLATTPPRENDTAIFREMFRTWQWSPNVPVATPLPVTSPQPTASHPTASTVASPGVSSFVLAGMTTKIETTATAANPKDFLTVIPKDSKAIYTVFSLKPGLTGQVNGALKQGDKVLVTLSLQYGPNNTWGDFRINSANGITPGAYTMAVTFVPTGETINLPFTVK